MYVEHVFASNQTQSHSFSMPHISILIHLQMQFAIFLGKIDFQYIGAICVSFGFLHCSIRSFAFAIMHIRKCVSARDCAIILAIYVLAYAKSLLFYVLLGYSTLSIGVACSIWFNNIISSNFFPCVSASLQRQNYCRLKKRWPMKLLLPQATNTYLAECECDFHFVFFSQFNFFGAPACEPWFFRHKMFSLFSLKSSKYRTEYHYFLPISRCSNTVKL